MRRGFKAEANLIAREVRGELGLLPADPLDVRKLAEHLAIPLVALTSLSDGSPRAVQHFVGRGQSVLSALTVFDGTRRVVLYNDAHSQARQASDIAHELSHALLLHKPHPALDQQGRRQWNRTLEEEATWLGGALLVPDEAALFIARSGMSEDVAAMTYGVSTQMVRWRLNVSAAYFRTGGTNRGSDEQRQ